MAAVALMLTPRPSARREAGAAAMIVAGALIKATVAALLPFMLLARRRVAPLLGALGAIAAGAIVAYAAFGSHGVNIVAALNRDAAFVSTDSFANEIAHLFGKPGVFPVDHDLLKAALGPDPGAPAVAHVARLRLGRRVGVEPARDLRDEHVAARLVHPVAAARSPSSRATGACSPRRSRCRGSTWPISSPRCWCRSNERARRRRPRRAARATGPGSRRACALASSERASSAGASGASRRWCCSRSSRCWRPPRSTTSCARRTSTTASSPTCATWRAYTHHDYKNVGADQQTLGVQTKRDVVCGNTEGGAPNSKTQICLVVTGPTARRAAHRLGRLVPAAVHDDDVRSVRYGCFGSVTMGRCPR